MKLDERQRGLLRLVEEYREKECRRILEAARQEAAQTLRQSYRKQRAYLHAQVVAERGRARARVRTALAEQATHERRAGERLSLELLASARPLLRERLLARWRIPEQRRRWAESYLRRALDLLPHGSWTVRHAPEWCDAERRELLAELTRELGATPLLRGEARIEAGLIVESDDSVLDASLSGLLQDRQRLDARLLALLDEGAGR